MYSYVNILRSLSNVCARDPFCRLIEKTYFLTCVYIIIIYNTGGISLAKEFLQAIHDYSHTPLFLPQYSPFLNSIEKCWLQ